MHKVLLGLAVLASASAGHATVQINFNSVTGNLGSNTHTYSSGAYSVTATGYSSFNPSANSGTANNLYGKNGGGDENGVGLVGDPSGQHEIWHVSNEDLFPAIVLNVSSILSKTSAAQFLMGSTTNGEQWILGGYNGSHWSKIMIGTGETWVSFPSWGTFTSYAFASGGTVFDGNRGPGNVLLSAVRFTPAVPEPGTWTMMLVGFAGIGIALRRKAARTALKIAY